MWVSGLIGTISSLTHKDFFDQGGGARSLEFVSDKQIGVEKRARKTMMGIFETHH